MTTCQRPRGAPSLTSRGTPCLTSRGARRVPFARLRRTAIPFARLRRTAIPLARLRRTAIPLARLRRDLTPGFGVLGTKTLLSLVLIGLAAGLAPPAVEAQQVDFGPQVVEEDLEDTGLAALPNSLPPIDEAQILERFAEAEALFNSTDPADQDTSLPLFGQLVELLEPQLAAGQLSDTLRPLLTRSLAYRAQVHFNFGEIELVEAGLTRMLEIDPSAYVDRSRASPKLVSQLDALRRRMLGELNFVLEPADAIVRVDGRVVDALAGPVAVLAGQRLIEVMLPGYQEVDRPLEVEADAQITLELSLERVSAVIRLHTRPAGATVTLDGAAGGVTEGMTPEGSPGGGQTLHALPQGPAAVYRREEFSGELVLEDIQPGLVLLEIAKEGFRTKRFELQIDELLDYPLQPIVLDPTSGSLVFNDFPRGAEIRLDGEVRRPDNPGSPRPQLKLSPGAYHVTVNAGPSKMFSTQLQLADRQTMEINVRLQPGLAFLGVLGGDQETARNLEQSLRLVLGETGKWSLINFAARAPQVLRDAGVSAETLRSIEQEAAAGARSSVDWQQVQAAVDAAVEGLVYVVAVPNNDLVATHASLWIWPRAPGPAQPDRVRLPLGDPAALQALKSSFSRTVSLHRAWVGALLIDTDGAPHPMVVDVTPASPAEAAGLAVGDLVAGVGGVPVITRAAFDERIAAAEIGEILELGVQSAAGPRTVKLKLGTSPALLASRQADLLESVAYSELVLLAEKAAPAEAWIVELDQILILLRAYQWKDAARRLNAIRAPQTSHGVGQTTVDYLLGIALSAAGADFRAGARQSFEKAAQLEGARLYHNDGAFIAPRARARLTALGG